MPYIMPIAFSAVMGNYSKDNKDTPPDQMGSKFPEEYTQQNAQNSSVPQRYNSRPAALPHDDVQRDRLREGTQQRSLERRTDSFTKKDQDWAIGAGMITGMGCWAGITMGIDTFISPEYVLVPLAATNIASFVYEVGRAPARILRDAYRQAREQVQSDTISGTLDESH